MVVDGESQSLTLHLDDDYRETVSFHRWFAMRGTSAARAAVAFTTSPDWLREPDKFALMASGNDAAIAAAIVQGRSGRRPDNAVSRSEYQEERLLDLCAGIGTVGVMAARLASRRCRSNSQLSPISLTECSMTSRSRWQKALDSATGRRQGACDCLAGLCNGGGRFRQRGLARRQRAPEGAVRGGRGYKTLAADCLVSFLRTASPDSLEHAAVRRHRLAHLS